MWLVLTWPAADAKGKYPSARRELRGVACARPRRGQAVLTAKALTNEESDALEMTLPVLPFGVKQRAAGSGVVFSGAGRTSGPSAIRRLRCFLARLTVTIAPSVAGTVFDALDYLTGYPWGCTEQTMSSFLPDLIVAQAVDKLHLKSPIDRATLNDMVRAGLDRLYGFQHDDGGWAGGQTTIAASS